MTYYVIDKDKKVFYQGDNKALAIEKYKEEPTAHLILYQPIQDGETFILRENH